MNDKNNGQSPELSTRMVEPEATERLKKRARDFGLIVNTGAKVTKPPDKKGDSKK